MSDKGCSPNRQALHNKKYLKKTKKIKKTHRVSYNSMLKR